ncbi:MAG: hypothetical protein FD153_2068 [Rhodospirillaceae bacterium]|nr:MAG: hypothetical protein FD153_2068 [Rhodospirillaceae bacterium]
MGTGTDGDHHQIGRYRAAIGQAHALDPRRSQNRFSVSACEKTQTAFGQIPLQETTGLGIELTFHQG